MNRISGSPARVSIDPKAIFKWKSHKLPVSFYYVRDFQILSPTFSFFYYLNEIPWLGPVSRKHPVKKEQDFWANGLKSSLRSPGHQPCQEPSSVWETIWKPNHTDLMELKLGVGVDPEVWRRPGPPWIIPSSREGHWPQCKPWLHPGMTLVPAGLCVDAAVLVFLKAPLHSGLGHPFRYT